MHILLGTVPLSHGGFSERRVNRGWGWLRSHRRPAVAMASVPLEEVAHVTIILLYRIVHNASPTTMGQAVLVARAPSSSLLPHAQQREKRML